MMQGHFFDGPGRADDAATLAELEARECADGWISWVHGYEGRTEGVGPEREDAERETKAMAVAVLPNAGGRRPPPRIEAPATDKPRRGRKPKAGAK